MKDTERCLFYIFILMKWYEIVIIILFVVILVLLYLKLRTNRQSKSVNPNSFPMLNLDEYKVVREFIKQKSTLLMDHEKKNHAKVGIAITNYRVLHLDGKRYYLIPTNMFKAIILEDTLATANSTFPQLFGTGNAKDVIQSIYNVEPWFDLDRFIEILQTEQFCYVVEVIGDKVQEKLLRIDLYRHIKQNSKGGFDFIGGIFHCYKHYSLEGNPLSTSKEINDIIHPRALIPKIINAFFNGKVTEGDKSTYISEIEINQKHLRLVFYLEEITGVYFITTVHPI